MSCLRREEELDGATILAQSLKDQVLFIDFKEFHNNWISSTKILSINYQC